MPLQKPFLEPKKFFWSGLRGYAENPHPQSLLGSKNSLFLIELEYSSVIL